MPTVEELFSLYGKTAVVTGGTRGIGAAMALGLAEAGANVVLVQRDTTNRDTFRAMSALGRTCNIVICDLSDRASVSTLASRVLQDIPRVDILLNCAGIQKRHPASVFPMEDWDAVLQVNLTTSFQLCRDFGKHMLSQEADTTGQRGTIINIASVLSFQGGIIVPAYAASKGGIAQLTKALSNEWAGKGVNVNAIAPGYIATDMNTALMQNQKRAESILERIPAGRWGNPEDFKGAVVFLASRAGAYCSGEMMTIDGGWMGR